MRPSLTDILKQLAPQAELADRHLWLIALCDWIRGDSTSPAAAVGRVQLLLDALQADPPLRERFRQWWVVLHDTVDSTMVLSDHGFSARHAFVSEAAERLRRKILPATPQTRDAAELFGLAFSQAEDVAWISALDAPTLTRLADLLSLPSAHSGVSQWQDALLQAITYCASHIRAIGFSPELRLRMNHPAHDVLAFVELAADVDAFRLAYLGCGTDPALVEAAAQRLRERLELCRSAAATVYPHLDEHGISVNLVFTLRQLRERVLRVRDLMDCLQSSNLEASAARLSGKLVQVGLERRSLRALMQSNASMLAAKVTERSAEAGEHYITRDKGEYLTMLRSAAGGGALTALTTLAKFAILGLGLAAFWSGMWSGLMYAASFVCIQLMHWTLATKQPAMTAPAMAAKLKDFQRHDVVADFVDEVSHLVRSQVASVLGNVGLVVPCVLLLSLGMRWASGHAMIDQAEANHVLHSLSLWHPSTLLFAAFTGVLLFGSSLIAGWVENWFVLHRLNSAMRYNPRIVAALGRERARRWAEFMRAHVSGLASNISLGMMLGLLPPVLGFIGLGLDVRHVTLSAGQLAAAVAAMDGTLWSSSEFWGCVAAIPLIGVLNLSVSFVLALRLALRAHNVSGLDRRRLRQAIWARMLLNPHSFLWPEEPAQPRN